MVDKFLTNKNTNNFQRKENLFNQPRAEIHLNYSEKPENEIIDFDTISYKKYSDKNVYQSSINFDKPSYSINYLKKINDLQNESKKYINSTKSVSIDYSSQQSSPRKRTASKPPKPNNNYNRIDNNKVEIRSNNNCSNYNPSTPICDYSNDWESINRGNSKNGGNNSFSQLKAGSNENTLNNICHRSNNFMTNDHNSSRRSNSNQSRKSNNSVSSVSNYLDKRHQQSQEKLIKIKMEKIQKETEELKSIPQISENSKKIVESLNQNGNVFDRLTYAKFEVII